MVFDFFETNFVQKNFFEHFQSGKQHSPKTYFLMGKPFIGPQKVPYKEALVTKGQVFSIIWVFAKISMQNPIEIVYCSVGLMLVVCFCHVLWMLLCILLCPGLCPGLCIGLCIGLCCALGLGPVLCLVVCPGLCLVLWPGLGIGLCPVLWPGLCPGLCHWLCIGLGPGLCIGLCLVMCSVLCPVHCGCCFCMLKMCGVAFSGT